MVEALDVDNVTLNVAGVVPLFPSATVTSVIEIVGATALTVKHPAQLPAAVSGLVTVTSRVPAGAFDATVMFAVSWIELTKVVELTVIPAPKLDVAPETKPVPVMVMFW